MAGFNPKSGLLGKQQPPPMLGISDAIRNATGWQPGTTPQWVPDWVRNLSTGLTAGTQQSMQNISDLTQRIPGAGPMTPEDFNTLMSLGMQGDILAYHGSPHTFDVFDTSKIGTGEGAQAYGHGLYFAENPGVARDYQTKLSPMTPAEAIDMTRPDAQAIADHQTEWDSLVQQHRDALKDGWRPTDESSAIQTKMDALHQQMVAETAARNPPQTGGAFYKVDIAGEPEHFLDWDKPLSEQPQHLATLKDRLAGQYLPAEKMTGQTVVKLLGEDKLQQAGIPGIRYLDQGSRGAGEGTHNYVVFDPANIKILERNAKPVPMLGK